MPVPFVRDNKTTLKVPIHAPVEEVWALLASAQGLSRWLPVACRGDVDAGSEFEMVWSPEPGLQDVSIHRVTLWEPRRRLGFTWPGVQLSFELTRQDEMTVVKLACTYMNREANAETQLEELVGWTMHLLTLKSVAEGGLDLRTPDKAFAWEKGFVTGI